jgi:hypothetical protein
MCSWQVSSGKGRYLWGATVACGCGCGCGSSSTSSSSSSGGSTGVQLAKCAQGQGCRGQVLSGVAVAAAA